MIEKPVGFLLSFGGASDDGGGDGGGGHSRIVVLPKLPEERGGKRETSDLKTVGSSLATAMRQ